MRQPLLILLHALSSVDPRECGADIALPPSLGPLFGAEVVILFHLLLTTFDFAPHARCWGSLRI